MSAQDASGVAPHSEATAISSKEASPNVGRRFWPEGWWRLTDIRVGIIPLPIYFLLIALVAALVYTGEIKSDGPTMIVVLVLGGFTCAEIGKRLPVLRSIGAGAIFATFIPSALAFYHLIPPQVEKSIIDFTKSTNFLYLFIASIIVGSIFAMDREVLIRGLSEDIRAARGRLRRRSDRRNRRGHRPRARRIAHVLLRRGSDHGRRRR